jgi:hypothetical protein
MPIPTVHIYEFDIAKSSPAFTRHIAGGSAAYVKELGSGTLASYLYFDSRADRAAGYEIYKTKVVVFRTSTAGQTVFNMRFYTPDESALSSGSSYYQYGISGVWTAFPTYANSGQVDMNVVPTTLPAAQNLFRQEGSASLTGILDTDVSQYLYLSLCLDDTFINGRYGSGGVTSFGRWEHRVTFDYT